MRNDAEKRFNEIVAEIIAQGWTIDVTRGFNQGHQGEKAKIAFTKGDEVKVVWLTSKVNPLDLHGTFTLEVKRYDIPAWEDTVWHNRGVVESTETFVEIQPYYRKGGYYIIAAGSEADQIIAKRKQRRANVFDVCESKNRPNLVNKATEILRASGIWGTKSDTVTHVRRAGSGYAFRTEKGTTYTLGTKGLTKMW